MKNTLDNYARRLKYRTKVYSRFTQLSLLPQKKQRIIDQFHELFYDSNILGQSWNQTFFLGIPAQKCPFDLFVYQEIVYELKPDIIIETGTAYGGGALYLATVCDQIKKGKVITIDVDDIKGKPKHRRMTFLHGSSTDSKIVERVKKYIKKGDKVMVILDSDHSAEHVLNELNIYNKFVTKGSYLIVEDTNVNGHPVYPDHGPGPLEAVKKFMKENKKFVIDKSREKFYLSFNPNGYLKKIK